MGFKPAEWIKAMKSGGIAAARLQAQTEQLKSTYRAARNYLNEGRDPRDMERKIIIPKLDGSKNDQAAKLVAIQSFLA